MEYTNNDLWAFVARADTHEKVNQASTWIAQNVQDPDLFDDLMMALAFQNREICHREMEPWFKRYGIETGQA